MSPTEQPEDSANRAPEQPAGSLRDLTWQLSRPSEPNVEPEADPLPNGQSVFSERSGIRDPLVKTQAGDANSSVAEEEAPYCPLSERPAKRGKKKKAAKGKGISDGKGKATQGKSQYATPPESPALKSRRQQQMVRRRQENYLQKRRKEKKLRVFYGRIRSILKLACAFLWAALLWELVQSPLWMFNAPRYQVSQQQLLQASQLAPLVQPWVGQPLYAIHTGKLARQIEHRFSVVDRAVVRRVMFPASLRIQVIEKRPWAGLYTPARYDQAQLLKASAASGQKAQASIKSQPLWWQRPYGMATGQTTADSQLIALAGYQIPPALFAPAEKILVMPGTRFQRGYWRQLREVAWQARQIKGLHLEAVDIREPQQVVLRYQEIPVILGQLNPSASERLARLVPLVPKIAEYRDVIESVDLKWEEQVTFHKRPNAQIKSPKEPSVQG